MFTELYTKVFPAIGEAFGELSFLAEIPFQQLIDELTAWTDTTHILHNIFNGQQFAFTIRTFRENPVLFIGIKGIGFAVDWYLHYLSYSPVWVVMLGGSFHLFIFIAMIKFVAGLF